MMIFVGNVLNVASSDDWKCKLLCSITFTLIQGKPVSLCERGVRSSEM